LAFYLAVDVGGTKTEYVLADETQELARFRGGTLKRMRADAHAVSENLDKALRYLTELTGVSMKSVTRTCVGTAGITVPLVADWIRQAFAERVAGSLLLLGDVEIALDAAFFGGPGVIVMAGTGSNVAGRDSTGHLTTAGGWGPALADQASGNRIGEQSLRDLFLAIDAGRSTSLLQAILDLWQLSDVDALVSYANQIPSPDLSQLAPIVMKCATEGDLVAKNVLKREGEELAQLVGFVIERVCRTDPRPGWLPEVAMTGSILKHIDSVREAIIDSLKLHVPGVKVIPSIVDPILGALWRARGG
jgi:glucosamine kinase